MHLIDERVELFSEEVLAAFRSAADRFAHGGKADDAFDAVIPSMAGSSMPEGLWGAK